MICSVNYKKRRIFYFSVERVAQALVRRGSLSVGLIW